MTRAVHPGAAALLLVAAAGCPAGPSAADASGAAAREPDARGAAERAFAIEYTGRLAGLTAGDDVRLWIPLPRDDPWQRIGEVTVEAPWPWRETRDPVHGNRILYLEGPAPGAAAEVVARYEVERWERRTDPASVAADGVEDDPAVGRYLAPGRLATPTARVEGEAARLAEGAAGTLAKGRAFYDHVLAVMSYDKSGEGWGRGDVAFACEVGKGNCTDYHAYFMSLCAAAGVASRFQIGIFGRYQPADAPYATGGYHCWAEFRVPGKGWVPVDISEADKDPARTEALFGGHTANRVTLSTGRDLVLEPAQAGAPLNFFVDPYAEVGGASHAGVAKEVVWTDRAAGVD